MYSYALIQRYSYAFECKSYMHICILIVRRATHDVFHYMLIGINVYMYTYEYAYELQVHIRVVLYMTVCVAYLFYIMLFYYRPMI